MKRYKKLSFLLSFCFLISILSGCSLLDKLKSTEEPINSGTSSADTTYDASSESVNSDDSSSSQEVSEPSSPDLSNAEILLKSMSLREKVGQLFIIRPDALDFTLSSEVINDPHRKGVTCLSDAMLSALQEYPAGGVVMFGKNISSPSQIVEFNKSLIGSLPIPMFLCIDEEGGLVSRLANHPAFNLPKYESAADVGKSENVQDAENMGDTIGQYLHDYGFNMDFAPDADVNTNPDNPIIGTRAFSSNAETAACLVRGMADGLNQNRIIPVFKHFPGHGDTKEDSHLGIAIANKQQSEMEHCEWLPFIQAKRNEGIMVGHIAVPQITGNLTPAAMSHKVVTDILKNHLGFEGLIITDSLSMQAITDTYSASDAAVMAFKAGCDVLLMPNDYREAFDGILDAVDNGTITEDELNQTVLRILECKEANRIL